MKFVDEATHAGAGRQRRAAAAPASGARSSCPSAARTAATAATAAASTCARPRASTRSRTFASSAPSRPATGSRAAPTTAPAAAAVTCTCRCRSAPWCATLETQEVLGDLTARRRSELLVARGGKGGWGNQRFKSSTNRTPRQFGPGPARGEALAGIRAQGDRGRGPARPAQCRQVDPHPRRVGRAPEGRRLSLHHAAPEPGRGGRRAAPQLRDGRHSRAHRGGRGRGRARHPLPEAPAAHARAAAPGGPAAAGPGGRPGEGRARDRRGAEEVQQGTRGQAALAGHQQDGSAAGSRRRRSARARSCARYATAGRTSSSPGPPARARASCARRL